MKTRLLYFSFLLTLLNFQEFNLQAQITRGAQPGEIYVATDWYADNTGMFYRALFRSINNGEKLDLKYETLWEPPPGEMRLAKILGDATPGAIYNYGWNELWVSFDYGQSWDYLENYSYVSYASGYSNGEIYKRSNNNLYRSDNYGNGFNLIVESLNEPLSDVGNQNGHLFGCTGNAGIGYNLFFSFNYGQDYIEIPIDSTVAFWQMGGYYPRISRGTEPGEIYLVSWWPDYHYKIFHSTDTGYTWTEKYESGYIDIYYWGVTYTAGRMPGSFYVLRGRLTPSQTHTWLYIDYSDDYGETFTTYFHDLDSLYTSVPSLHKAQLHIKASPNPLKTNTTISFQLPKGLSDPLLKIYDLNGNQVKQFNISGKHAQNWDGTDETGNRVKDGLYFFNISYDNFSSQFNKLLIIN